MEADRLKSILESLLFTAEGPSSVDRLRGAIGSIERRDVTQALKELQEEYETQKRGVRLMEVANGFQLRTPKEHAEYIKNLVPVKTARMSHANLETLAIIAYKQPITKAEIEEIRGVNVDGVVSTLLDRRLVRIVARKDVPGKPFLYGTTKEFLEIFNLKDLAGLPTLKEMEEMSRALADDARFAPEGPADRRPETGDRELETLGGASEDSAVVSEMEFVAQSEPAEADPDSAQTHEKE
jgi:segregation and condensation protein B